MHNCGVVAKFPTTFDPPQVATLVVGDLLEISNLGVCCELGCTQSLQWPSLAPVPSSRSPSQLGCFWLEVN